ncbi:MAG TPA: tyrosine--tRNA ligase [Candidatus Paceibacterota bacterium]|nr:tyrosine--tRNA ligase [Candidatus Paceibacterota bacterium]
MSLFKKTASIDTRPEKIEALLSRGVEDVFVMESLKKKLMSGKPLRIKFGIDPTGPTIHLGRAIPLRKLKAFQDLGHTIVLVIGDFTARIGDPSDKIEKRPMLTEAKIKENLKGYKKIINKIIDVSRVEFVYNGSWLSKLGFSEITELAESFSVQQMSNRRNFKERLDKGEEISLREFLYPLMQGYDSVAVSADVEIGGFDQLFNLKAGRVIQKHYGMPEQDVLTFSMLPGTDGRKMSTSWGNVINITDTAQDIFGKTMSLHDNLITTYFLLCTDVSLEEIKKIESDIAQGANPRDAKVRLAKEIVSLYHSPEDATKAEKNFFDTFNKGGVPEDAPLVTVVEKTPIADVVISSKLVASKTEFKRLVGEGAITDVKTGKVIEDFNALVLADMDLKIGKHRFLKIRK